MVEYVVMPIEVGILIADGVETMGAGGDYLAPTSRDAGEGVVKRCDVFHGQLLEQKLVSSTAGGVTSARFALS